MLPVSVPATHTAALLVRTPHRIVPHRSSVQCSARAHTKRACALFMCSRTIVVPSNARASTCSCNTALFHNARCNTCCMHTRIRVRTHSRMGADQPRCVVPCAMQYHAACSISPHCFVLCLTARAKRWRAALQNVIVLATTACTTTASCVSTAPALTRR